MSNRQDFNIRSLEGAYIPDLISLQRQVSAALPDPEVFMLHDEAYFSGIFDLPSAAIGAFCRNRLIAYCFIIIPGSSQANLGRDINLPLRELSSVAHIQAAAVHPDYRGHGLQKMMLEEQLKNIEEQGYRHACCTVSPKNPVSLKNVLSCGLLIEALRPKLNGWCRYIMHKDLRRPAYLPDISQEEKCIAVSISDLKAQAELLKAGFAGFEIAACNGGHNILFAHLRN